MDAIGRCHWAAALLVSSGVHVALALALAQAPSPQLPIVELTLTAAGTAPGGNGPSSGAEVHDRAPAPETSRTDEAAEPVSAAFETAPPPMPWLRSEPPPEPQRTPKPEPKSAAKPRRVEPPPVKPAPRSRSEPEHKQAPRDRVAEPAKRPGRARGAVIDGATRNGTAVGGGEMRAGGQVAESDAPSGSGAEQALAAYRSALARALERHKRYPESARRLRQEGTVRLRFTVDRQGRILSHRILAGSGHAALDRAVEDMLRRAAPLPPMPAGIGQSELTLAIPIEFALR